MKRLPLLSAHCLDRTVLSSVQRVDLWLSHLFVQFVSSCYRYMLRIFKILENTQPKQRNTSNPHAGLALTFENTVAFLTYALRFQLTYFGSEEAHGCVPLRQLSRLFFVVIGDIQALEEHNSPNQFRHLPLEEIKYVLVACISPPPVKKVQMRSAYANHHAVGDFGETNPSLHDLHCVAGLPFS